AGYLIVFDRFAAFKIGGGRSQPEMHGYFRPSLAAPKFVLAAPSVFWRPCGTRAAEQFRFTYMYYMYLHKKQAGKAEALPPLECAYGAKSPRKGRGRIEARCGGFAAHQAQVIDRELSSSI
ncbi:hypothetical protein N7320_22230, partial [Stutzerimonas stutzeri]|uniref:hypothetical protein n=1 Tax=Stutzerimonas stutzeri TaxID=316 RepID=UPI00244D14C9